MVPQDDGSHVKFLNVSHDANRYYIDTQITRAGTYGMMATLMEAGSLRASLFHNPDFTGYHTDHRVAEDSTKKGSGGMNMTFDTFVDNHYFRNHTNQFSMVLQGCVRFENTTFYNLTFESNMKLLVYFDQK